MPRVVIDASDALGRTTTVEVTVRRDTVEWWLGGRSVAMVDREVLARWLARPVGTFQRHELELWVSALGPVLEVTGRVMASVFAAEALNDLRRAVNGEFVTGPRPIPAAPTPTDAGPAAGRRTAGAGVSQASPSVPPAGGRLRVPPSGGTGRTDASRAADPDAVGSTVRPRGRHRRR